MAVSSLKAQNYMCPPTPKEEHNKNQHKILFLFLNMLQYAVLIVPLNQTYQSGNGNWTSLKLGKQSTFNHGKSCHSI